MGNSIGNKTSSVIVRKPDDVLHVAAKLIVSSLKASKGTVSGFNPDNAKTRSAVNELLILTQAFSQRLVQVFGSDAGEAFLTIASKLQDSQDRLSSGAFRYGDISTEISNSTKTEYFLDSRVGLDSYDKFLEGLLTAETQEGTRCSDLLRSAHSEFYNGVREFIERHVSRWEPIRAKPMLRVMTTGSCFADNLARELRSMSSTTNASVDHYFIHEQINYPALLLDIVQSAFGREPSYHSSDFCWIDRDRLKNSICCSDLIVITLGSNLGIVDKDKNFIIPQLDDKGISRLPNGMRLVSALKQNIVSFRQCFLHENEEYLKRLIEVIQMENDHVKIMLTLSPVPIAATYGMDAVMEDCISKSNLRVVINNILLNNPDVLYLPSFEVVKWSASHFAVSSYGYDDGNLRHVNNDLVHSIVEPVCEWINRAASN